MANGNNNDWDAPSNTGGGPGSENSELELNQKRTDRQPPGGGGGQGGGSGGGNFGEDNMGLGEGWGTGEASIDEVVDNVKRVFQAFQGEIMFAWLALAGVTLLFALGETLFALLSVVTGVGVFGIFQAGVGFLGGLIGVGVVAAQFTLFRPLKRKIFQNFDPGDWQTALKSNLQPVLWILLTNIVLGFASGLGMACCILPGLLIAFLGSMAPYLVATRPDIDMVDAFKQSYLLAKKYWQIFAITIGALIGAGMVAGCFFGMAALLVNLAGSAGYIVEPGLSWVGATLFQLGVFCVWGGVFITVDQKEGATA